MSDKTYLGDSVYVQPYPNGIILTTNNGLNEPHVNIIYLEWDVINHLMRYINEEFGRTNSGPSPIVSD